MRSLFLSLFISVGLLLLNGCKEESPYINFTPSLNTYDTTYIDRDIAPPDVKEVLLEDISGVKCKNCPKAAVIAQNLKNTYQGRLNVITMQPLNFNSLLTSPFHKADGDKYDTRHDYRTAACIAICEHVAKPASLPSGYIDRKTFPGKTDAVLDEDDWVEKVANQAALPSPVNIAVDAKHEDGKVTIDVILHYTASVAKGKKHNLSVALVQDSVIDVQENDGVFDSAYVNMHLLRDMVTAYTGDGLNQSLVAGRIFKKRYVYAIRPSTFNYAPFVIRNMHVVAYVHEDAASGKEVIQSKEVHVTE